VPGQDIAARTTIKQLYVSGTIVDGFSSVPSAEVPSFRESSEVYARHVLGVVLPGTNILIVIDGGDAALHGSASRLVAETLELLPSDSPTHVRGLSAGDFQQYWPSIVGKGALAHRLIVDLRTTPEANLQRLTEAFLKVASSHEMMARLYLSAMGIILIGRFSSETLVQAASSRRAYSSLPKWRLKRVVEHIDAHLGEDIRLSDLAAEARLTRMHFAAQFKAATGVRPHEYLLRRRIARAQELLLDSHETIVGVALTVGFRTQAHFTTVFKRFVGETPYRWRRVAMEHRASADFPDQRAERTDLQALQQSGLKGPAPRHASFLTPAWPE